MNQEKGCTTCPFAGHIDLKECPNAYTEISEQCGLYKHEHFYVSDNETKNEIIEKRPAVVR